MKQTIMFLILTLAVVAGCQHYRFGGFTVNPIPQPLNSTHYSDNIGDVMRGCAEVVRKHAAEAEADVQNSLYVQCLTFNGVVI